MIHPYDYVYDPDIIYEVRDAFETFDPKGELEAKLEEAYHVQCAVPEGSVRRQIADERLLLLLGAWIALDNREDKREKFEVIDVEPIGYRTTYAFCTRGVGASHPEPISVPSYPDACMQASTMRDLRRRSGVTMGQVGRALGIGPADVCGLESGRKRPAKPGGWAHILTTILTMSSR